MVEMARPVLTFAQCCLSTIRLSNTVITQNRKFAQKKKASVLLAVEIVMNIWFMLAVQEFRMAKCKLSGKGPLSGNRDTFSKKKTRRKWQPNVQKRTIYVPELKRSVRVKASARAMKTVNRIGLMEYLRKNGLKLKDVT